MIVAELAAVLGLDINQSQWAKGNELVESLHHAVEAYVGAEALSKLGEMVESTVSATVEAKHLGERLGITTQAVQELGYAADVTGVGAEGMQGAMQHMVRSLATVQKGTGPAVDALKKLHISTSDAVIKSGTLDEKLMRVADGFANAGPEVDKTQVSMELFGSRTGTRLLPLLNKGADGIQEFCDEAKKLGIVMGDEDVEKAEEFEISQKRLHATLTGLKNEAVMALLPALQEMIEGLQEWVGQNREAIASTLESVIRGIAAAFKFVGSVIGEATEFFEEHQRVAEAVLATIGAVIAAFAISAAADWILAFWPVAAAVAAIAALTLGIEELVDVTSGGTGDIEDSWNNVMGAVEGVVNYVSGLPGEFEDWMASIGQSIKDEFQEAWDYAVNSAKQAWRDIEDTPVIGDIVRGGEWIADKLGGSPSDAIPAAQYALSSNQLGGSSGVQQTNSYGDVHVEINGAGAPDEELAHKVGKAVEDSYKTKVQEAFDAFKGGKR